MLHACVYIYIYVCVYVYVYQSYLWRIHGCRDVSCTQKSQRVFRGTFWELDSDHDFLLDKDDLLKYDGLVWPG